MATPEQLDKENIELSRQQIGYSQQFEAILQNQVQLARTLNQEIQAGTKSLKDQRDTIEDEVSAAKKLSDIIEIQLGTLKKSNEYSSRYAELKEKINKAQDQFTTALDKSKNISDQLTGDGQKAAQGYLDGLAARYKLSDKLAQLAQKENQLGDALRGIGSVTVEQAREEYLTVGKQVAQLREQERIVNEILSGNFENLGNLSDQDKILLKQFAVQQQQLDIARNISQNHKDELDTLKNQLSPFQKIVSYTKYYIDKLKEFPGIKGALNFVQTQLDQIGISFQAILKNVLALDKTLTDFGKSVQVGKEGARELADSFQDISYRASEFNSNVSATQASIKNQIEANNELNASLGTGALFTAQTRLDQIELVKGMGLQAEAGAKIYQLGKLNNMTAHETAVAIGDQVVNVRKATGVTLDYRKVLTDVSKVSGQLAVQYKNNPQLIAEAVTQAHLLGLELSQTAKMGSSLVDDFAGSLGKELEAELLTGKRLNLEQARYYALMGDSSKAAKELMDNVGGIEEFQKLNVLQQKSLAAAIGLTTDELSDALFKQEQLKGTTFETEAAFKEAAKQAARTGDYTALNAELARAANGEELAKQASQISNQEKFQMAIEKLQETVANMVNGPFGALIDRISTLVSKAGTLKFIVGAIAGIIGINMVSGLLSVGKGIASVIPKFAALAAEATFMNSLLTFGLGLAVAAAAAGIGYGIINSLSGGEANVSGASGGGGGGGINIPNSGARGDKNININLVNDNTTYVGGQQVSHLSTAIQKNINTRTS